MNKIVLFHGSEKIIIHPELSLGRDNNDYGKGFYCTLDFDLANEWACKNNNDGYVNEYSLNLDELNVLDLRDEKYNVLHWICILINNRTFKLNNLMIQTKEFLNEKYSLDLSKYDLIIGYRADDSYFDYAKSFLNNSLSLENLSKALIYGDLGIQYALVSKKAFSHLSYLKASKSEASIYYKRFYIRDLQARNSYIKFAKNSQTIDGTYIMDLLRGKKNDASL